MTTFSTPIVIARRSRSNPHSESWLQVASATPRNDERGGPSLIVELDHLYRFPVRQARAALRNLERLRKAICGNHEVPR